MPPFLHLFCFAPKRNTTLTKTFATPKSFTKGLVLLSVHIIAYFPNSRNIDFATSTAYSKISNTTTYSDEMTMATIEIPSTGKYYIEAIVGGTATSDSASQWRIKKGSTAFVANTFNHITRDGTPRFSGSIATIADCTVGDEIILTAEILYGGGGTATARDGQYFLATRIS